MKKNPLSRINDHACYGLMKWRMTAFVAMLCIFVIIAVLFTGCDLSDTSTETESNKKVVYKYEFINNTPYEGIHIYLSEPYKTDIESTVYLTDSLRLDRYNLRSIVVYIESELVEFEWTAGYEVFDANITLEKLGAKVIFKRN